METLSCLSNQTKEQIFIKKNTTFQSPSPRMLQMKFWAESAHWLQKRCRLKGLTPQDARQKTDNCLSCKLPILVS